MHSFFVIGTFLFRATEVRKKRKAFDRASASLSYSVSPDSCFYSMTAVTLFSSTSMISAWLKQGSRKGLVFFVCSIKVN